MKVTVKDLKGNSQGELEVRFQIIETGKGTQAVHDTVVAYMAAQRSGTASTKTMGEVAGTGKKPWRQKGTGRARAGSFASPLWRGGGVVFGPKPRDFRKRVPKAQKQLALRKAMSERLKSGDVIVVDEFTLETSKTKAFINVLNSLQVEGTVLIVTPGVERNLVLASRNVPDVTVTTSDSVNTYDLLRCAKLVFTRPAFEKLEERLATDKESAAAPAA